MGLGGSKRQRTEEGGEDGEDGYGREEYHRGDDNVWRGGGKPGTSGAGRAHVDVRDMGNSLYSCADGDGGGAPPARGELKREPGSVAGYGLVTDEDGDVADEFIQCDPPPPAGGAAHARGAAAEKAAGDGKRPGRRRKKR